MCIIDWVLVKLQNSVWDFLGFHFGPGDFLGFTSSPRDFLGFNVSPHSPALSPVNPEYPSWVHNTSPKCHIRTSQHLCKFTPAAVLDQDYDLGAETHIGIMLLVLTISFQIKTYTLIKVIYVSFCSIMLSTHTGLKVVPLPCAYVNMICPLLGFCATL